MRACLRDNWSSLTITSHPASRPTEKIGFVIRYRLAPCLRYASGIAIRRCLLGEDRALAGGAPAYAATGIADSAGPFDMNGKRPYIVGWFGGIIEGRSPRYQGVELSAFCPRCGCATGPKDRFCKRCGG